MDALGRPLPPQAAAPLARPLPHPVDALGRCQEAEEDDLGLLDILLEQHLSTDRNSNLNGVRSEGEVEDGWAWVPGGTSWSSLAH